MQHAAHHDPRRGRLLTQAVHLDVGPLRIRLRTDGPAPVRYSAPAYAGFFSSDAPRSGTEPLATLPLDVALGPSSVPARPPLWRIGPSWAVWEAGADLLFLAGFHAQATALFGCRVARDVSRAELAVAPQLPGSVPGQIEAPLRYPLDQVVSWGMLSRIGGALLHAAVAVRDGVGYVFAGRSGAGKSTLAGLCCAEGWRILNDDRAMVFRRGGQWRVAGTPWHGSGRFAEAAEVPLGGIYLLRQARGNRLEPVSRSRARLALLDVAAVPWFEDSWAQGILDGLNRLVGDVDVRRFHFTKTPAAVQALTLQEGARPDACARSA